MSCDLGAIERHILAEVWTSDEIYRNLVHLCDDLGNRFGGSESEHAAAEFLRSKMVEYGLQNVHLEEFPTYTWERGECQLDVTAPVEKSLSAIAMPYAGSGEFRGALIDVGQGEQADFDRLGDEVRGKIVLTDAETHTQQTQRPIHRTDKFRWAVEAGATACIFVNRNPGLLHITGALYARKPGSPDDADHEAPIPGIGVSHETGSRLRRLLERGEEVQVRIQLQNRTYLSHSYNVVGDIPGSGANANEIVLFGGHYDGHDIAQGAGDDAAGTLVGLEIGRVLASFAGQFERTLRIICFGCEEIGLIGAWKHAERYSNNQDETLRFVMNLDGAGRGQGGQERVTITGDKSLEPYFRNFSEEHHYAFNVTTRLSVHSDHFPFLMAGFPSGTLNSQDSTAGMIGRGYGHTEGDTVDKVTLRGLQMGSALAARVAAKMACDENLPMEGYTDTQVREMLEENDQVSVLQHHWGRENRPAST